MADSLRSIDKRCIFRETFESEQTVRKCGVLLSGAYTFANGKFTTTHGGTGFATYEKIIRPSFTVRIKVRFNTINNTAILFEGKRDSNYFDIYLNVGSNLASTNLTKLYVNAVERTTATFVPVVNTDYDIVVTTTSNISKFTIGAGLAGGWGVGADFELVEIYQGLLTADEVKNLYENKRHRDLMPNHTEHLGAELCVNGDFSNGISGWTGSGATISNVDNHLRVTIAVPGWGGGTQTITTIAGRRYFFTGQLRLGTGSSCQLWVGTSPANNDLFSTGVLSPAEFTTTSGYFTATSTTTYITCVSSSALNDQYNDFDNISIKEVCVESIKEILNVSAFSGTIRNKYSGEVYGNNKISNPNFDTDTAWTKNGWVISNGIASCDTVDRDLIQYNVITIGKTYDYSFNARKTSGNPMIQFYMGVSVTSDVFSITSTDWVTYRGRLTADDAGIDLRNVGATGAVDVDNIVVKEVIPSVTTAGVNVVKDNDVYAMNFYSNGYIQCGSYDDMTGNLSINIWFKHQLNTGQLAGRNFYLLATGGTNRLTWEDNGNNLFLFRDNSTFAYTTIPLGSYYKKPTMLTVTSDATGNTAFYINGVAVSMYDSSTGTPTPWLEIILGIPSAYFPKGLIYSISIIKGILTAQEIAQIYSSEKSKYGL